MYYFICKSIDIYVLVCYNKYKIKVNNKSNKKENITVQTNTWKVVVTMSNIKINNDKEYNVVLKRLNEVENTIETLVNKSIFEDESVEVPEELYEEYGMLDIAIQNYVGSAWA